MLDALRQLGCRVEARRRRRCASPASAARLRRARGRPVPRQRGHRDAAAGRRAGAAGGDAGRPLRAARRAAHARAADRRPRRRAATARLRDRLPRQPGFPPLRLQRRRAAPLRLDAPIRVRGDVSSQFLTRCCWRCRWSRRGRDVVDRGRRRADLQALRRDHAEPAGALRHRRRSATAGSASRFRAGSAYRSPGRIHVEGDASSASYFIAARRDRRGATRRCASKAWAATRSRATSASSTPRGRWARRSTRSRTGSRCARGALAAEGHHARLQPHPRRGDDAGGDGAVRRRARRALTNIASWRVKETDRIAAMAAELRKLGADGRRGRRLHRRSRRPRRWRAGVDPTPTTTTAWRCASRWPPSTAPPARAALPVRIHDPRCVAKTFPDYFETLFGVAAADARRDPGDHDRRPDRVRQGHAGQRGRRGAGLPPARLGRAVPRDRARRAAAPASTPTTRRRSPALARTLDLRFDAGRILLAGEDVSRRAAPRGRSASLASRISACRAVREALRELQLSFRRLPGLVADGRDMGTVVFPDAGAQGLPHRERRRARRAAA